MNHAPQRHADLLRASPAQGGGVRSTVYLTLPKRAGRARLVRLRVRNADADRPGRRWGRYRGSAIGREWPRARSDSRPRLGRSKAVRLSSRTAQPLNSAAALCRSARRAASSLPSWASCDRPERTNETCGTSGWRRRIAGWTPDRSALADASAHIRRRMDQLLDAGTCVAGPEERVSLQVQDCVRVASSAMLWRLLSAAIWA
jgi:hypothetical protein